MSGGQLVVLDRLGREMKRYRLESGLATLGSDPACDIRIMLPTVSPHHATVVVHANQTVVRNVCLDNTLVNGQCVSVTALQHGDIISIGGRSFRWEYFNPKDSHQPSQPALAVRRAGRAGRAGRAARAPRRVSAGPAPVRQRDRAVQLALEMSHRASMPGSTGGKQVAIVQPQRRDTAEQNDRPQSRTPPQQRETPSKRGRASRTEAEALDDKAPRRPRLTPNSLHNTTKATLWIESRKTSPRKSSKQSPKTMSIVQSPKVQTPKVQTPKVQTPKVQTLKAQTPKVQTPKVQTPKVQTPKAQTPKVQTPKAQTPKVQTPKAQTPKVQTPKAQTPKAQTPKAQTSKVQTPKAQTPKVKSPRLQSLRVQALKAQTPKHTTVQLRRNTMSGKKSTPLRLTVLKRAQSAHKMKVTKIEAPLTIDHTKQAALFLMAGGTRRAAPALRVNKRHFTPRHSRHSTGNTVSILEITDSERNSTRKSNTTQWTSQSSIKSPLLPSPRKSALKDPTAKKSARKTESIKFDLSNLEGHSSMDGNYSLRSDNGSISDDEITLRYSTHSSVQSPSPRRSIHSRSSRILQSTLGTTLTISPPSERLPQQSPRQRKSSRSSFIIQKALDQTHSPAKSEISQNGTASAFRTRTLSPRSEADMESYSIVDLVSMDSESGRSTSVYNSAGSDTTAFGTPQSAARKTRSTIDPKALGSSTPYLGRSTRFSRSRSSDTSKTSANGSVSSRNARRSKSMTTPENSNRSTILNSTKISRASRSRSRINDSDLLLIEDDDDSPRSSRRVSTASKSKTSVLQASPTVGKTQGSPQQAGTSTPENTYSPEEATTPVLSIQSLLDSSQSSLTSEQPNRRGRKSFRNTIEVITNPKTRVGTQSKSLTFSARKTRLRLSSDSVEQLNNQGDKAVTPKSAVKLVPEGVKNKHSTAKKPLSKRSIIDDLNESLIVKQLFNSPVKRKLSQSMTEFSKNQSEDEEIKRAKRPKRNTCNITPDNSFLDNTEAYTPEIFVSPISTPTNSPNLRGIKSLFGKNTPENDLRNVRGVKALLRTPRTRKSVANDLTNIQGVKAVFARSPRNRLSDVRVKEVFAASPNNDLRRVSGVKSLFQSGKQQKSPKNDLSDVRGVKKLFSRKSPVNDLRNISGVKRTLRKQSPRNDLRDVRGVKKVFRQQKETNNLSDVSGVEELFNGSSTSHKDSETLFDQLLGKPPVKAVYSKTFTKVNKKSKPKRRSLHVSVDVVADVEGWLEKQLSKCLHKEANEQNKSKAMRELQKLATDTVEGGEPIRSSRVRNSTIHSVNNNSTAKKSASEIYSMHTLPIKKRSLTEAKDDRGRLPIKKRAVVHSTPVKGRVNLTMNASELGRVSPIAAVDNTNIVDSLIRSDRPQPETNRKSRRVTKTNPKILIEFEIPPLSPKMSITVSPSGKSKSSTKPKAQTPKSPTAKSTTPKKVPTPKRATRRGTSKSKLPSPKASPKLTRTRIITAKATSPHKISITIPNVEKVQSTEASGAKADAGAKTKTPSPKAKKVVSTKAKNTRPTKSKPVSPKTNVVSPKTVAEKKQNSKEKSLSPPKTRTTRAGKSKPTSPKAKPSPKRNNTRATKSKLTSPKDVTVETKSRSTRGAKTNLKIEVKTPTKDTAIPRSTRRAKSKQISPKTKTPSPNKTTRSRKKAASPTNAKKKAPALVIGKKTPVMTPKKTSRKRKEPETKNTTPLAKKTRGNKQVVEQSPKSSRSKPQIVAVASTQSKRGKPQAKKSEVGQSIESPKKPRTQKQSEKSQAIEIPKTRGRRTVVETAVEKPKRGRKVPSIENTTKSNNKTVRKMDVSKENVPETSRSRRGQNPVSETNARKRKSTAAHDEMPAKVIKSGRGRKGTVAAVADGDTNKNNVKIEAKQRGRKLITEIAAESPKGRLKRKATIKTTPVADQGKKSRGKKTSEVPASKVTRVADAEANKPAGRSRRR